MSPAMRLPLRLLYGPTFEREGPTLIPPRKSPYLDSVQMGVQCRGTFPSSAWDGPSLPTITGRVRVYSSFKPEKIIVDEQIIAAFAGKGKAVAVTVDSGRDLLLASAFCGNRSLFPFCQDGDGRISPGVTGSSFSAFSLANGVSWPLIPAGTDLTITFAVRPSVLYRAEAPNGDGVLASIEVFSCLTLFGAQTKE